MSFSIFSGVRLSRVFRLRSPKGGEKGKGKEGDKAKGKGNEKPKAEAAETPTKEWNAKGKGRSWKDVRAARKWNYKT